MSKKMTLCIKDVMQRPIFKRAKVIAGKNGMNRTVGWVHVLEITNVAAFVNKNDLILTTGLWLKRSEAERLAYMQQLIEQNAAGLSIEFGTTIDEVPEDIIALSNQNNFPLIVFDQPVRFVEITQDIHSLLINQHHQMIRDLQTYSRNLQQLTLGSSDIPVILRLLHEYTSKQIVYISLIDSNKFYPSITSELADYIAHYCQKKVDKSFYLTQETKQFKMDDKRSLLIQPVVCFGQIFSYVGIILLHQTKPTEFMKLMLDYTTKAVATLLLRTQFLEEKMLRNQNELIQDILDHRIENEETAQRSMGLRLLTKGEYLFIGGIIEAEYEQEKVGQERMSTNQDILVLFQSLLKKHSLFNLVIMKNNSIYVLCAKESLTEESYTNFVLTLQNIAQDLKNYNTNYLNGVVLHIGFGRTRNSIIETSESFKEAYQVIEVSRTVPAMKNSHFYEKIGIYQLIKALPKHLLILFVNDYLGELIESDKERRFCLLETLDVYFKCHGSKGDVAKRLFIHRQTLYNRLEKLTEVLGNDFFEPEKRICLEMALLANEMINTKK